MGYALGSQDERNRGWRTKEKEGRGGNLHPGEEASCARTGTIHGRGTEGGKGTGRAARGLGGWVAAGGLPAMASSPMPTQPSDRRS